MYNIHLIFQKIKQKDMIYIKVINIQSSLTVGYLFGLSF